LTEVVDLIDPGGITAAAGCRDQVPGVAVVTVFDHECVASHILSVLAAGQHRIDGRIPPGVGDRVQIVVTSADGVLEGLTDAA